MFLILRKNWEVLDAERGQRKTAIIPAGRHEIVRIPNPYGTLNMDWLVLTRTKIGMAELFWKNWENFPDPDARVRVIES